MPTSRAISRVLAVVIVIAMIVVAFGGYFFGSDNRTTDSTTIISTNQVTSTVVEVSLTTVSNSVYLITETKEIIGVVSPETATLTIIASPNCTVLIPTLNPPILGYNSTTIILPQENTSTIYSVATVITTFSQMPSAKTVYTTIAESNAEIEAIVVSGNSTYTTMTCPAYA